MSTEQVEKSQADTGQFKWYIVKTKANCEAKACDSVKRLITDRGFKSQVQDILVPEKEIVDIVRGKKITRSKRIYPGYIFIQMELSNSLWHLIKSATHVINFVGKQGQPVEVPLQQIESITKQIEEEQKSPHTRISFAVEEAVKVIDGPFKGFSGVVEEVNQEKARVKVSVSIFGRPTPVELDFAQVHREE